MAPSTNSRSTSSCAYFIQNDMLMKNPLGKNSTPEAIARRVDVSRVLVDVDTGRNLVELSFDALGRSETRRVPLGMLTRQKIMELLDFGVDVADHNASDVLKWLHTRKIQAPQESGHTHLGLGTFDDGPDIRLYQGIRSGSTYQGDLLLRPTGSYAVWRELVQEYVCGFPMLELALSLGFSALVGAILHLLRGLEVLIFHLYWRSSTGKSTAARVATASFGLPHTVPGGLMKTWNGSDVELLSHFRHNHGVPIALDDASTTKREDYSDLLYQLAQGKDRGRLTRDGDRREPATWSGLILSTAEHSLLERSNQNAGLRVRVFEVGNQQWTSSAEHSRMLTKGLLENYGQAAPLFGRRLLDIGLDQVQLKWQEQREIILQGMIARDDLSDRIADKLGVVMTGASLASQWLGLPLDLDAMRGILLRLDSEAVPGRDAAISAYSRITAWIIENRAHFEDDGAEQRTYDCWGRLESTPGGVIAAVFTERLEKILATFGFNDPKGILASWRQRGWLLCESGRLTRKRTFILNGQKVETRVYLIRLGAQATDVDGRVGPADPAG